MNEQDHQPVAGLWPSLVGFVRDIRLEHSVFALPFALLGMLLAGGFESLRGTRAAPWPSGAELGWILTAMVGARSAAMGFNRLVDQRIDAANPRTARRPLASGALGAWGRPVYAALIVAGSALLAVAAAHLNPLALRLVPLALLILFCYSFTKRFTALCHYFVGLALAVSPLAAAVAVSGRVPTEVALYALAGAVLVWVGGFDILYATLDLEFDQATGIRSLPARWGVGSSLLAAKVSHGVMLLLLVAVGVNTPFLGWRYGLSVAVAAALLIYEHAIVRPDDLRRVNTAFFTLNGALGVLLAGGGLWDMLSRTW